MPLVRALVAIALAGGTAAASPFRWDAPAGCPTEAEVRQRIERRLDAGVPAESVHGVAVAITRDHGTYVAAIDVGGLRVANALRRHTSARCTDLADAVAVIVARLAGEDHRATERAIEIEVTPAPPVPASGSINAFAPASSVRIEQRAPRLAVPAAPAHRTWGYGGRLLGLSGIGIVPSVGVGMEAGGFVRRDRSFVELGVATWSDKPRFLVESAPAAVLVGLFTSVLRAGWAPPDMPLRAWLGVELGSIRGEGRALQDAAVGRARWTSLVGGVSVAWPMSERTRLVGTFEVGAAVERTRFTLVDGQVIYRPAPVSARTALGIEFGWR